MEVWKQKPCNKNMLMFIDACKKFFTVGEFSIQKCKDMNKLKDTKSLMNHPTIKSFETDIILSLYCR